MRKIIGQLDFLRLGQAELLQGELELVAVALDARIDLDHVAASNVLRGSLKLIPHHGFDRAAPVAEIETQIGLARAGVSNFFFVYEEIRGDGLFGDQIADERRLHQSPESPGFLPNKRYFLWPFFVLVTSGVALTS